MKKLNVALLSGMVLGAYVFLSPVLAQADDASTPALTLGSSAEWGAHLVTAEGLSVYLYVLDEDGVVACVDACATNWPPLLAAEGSQPTVSTDLDPELLGTVERPEGGVQLTYAGHPLYTYRRDSEAGHTRGQRLGNQFFLLTAGGEAIAEAVAAETVVLDEAEMARLMDEGRLVLRTHCAACHGAEGQGGIGPGFVGNSQLANTPYVVNRVLDGFIDHGMPPFAGVLSDRQISAVATHIRNSWGNDFGAVVEEEVAKER